MWISKMSKCKNKYNMNNEWINKPIMDYALLQY